MLKKFINKGNYSSIEPAERELAFEVRRGEGWPVEYAAYRAEWGRRPMEKDPGEWPLLVDLELSTVCNLRCPMCYTITDAFKSRVTRGLMPKTIFKRIIDEIAPHVPAVRLSLRGEPTLHPDFIECLEYAKKKGSKEVSFLTNAGSLNTDFSRKIIEAGADWITVSIDGMGAVYENIRKPLVFARSYEKLQQLLVLREKLGKTRPVIKVQSVWPAIAGNFVEWYETMHPVADLLAFNPLIDVGRDSESEIEYEDDFFCPQLYQRLVIGADGIALPCANDENGTMPLCPDIAQSGVYELWHGEALSRMREVHSAPCGFKKYATCRHCFLPRKTESVSMEMPDGRQFLVPNYTNRKQVVGQ